ncbi:MAG: hypothetical protein WC527_07225 [Candidatus Margulisiibacteriota bacterium]
MKKFFKRLLIVLLVLAGLVLVFLAYMGVLSKPSVSETKMGPYLFVYEEYVGPYMNSGKIFDKVYKSVKTDGIETEKGLGIYFDNPSKVPADKLRSQCGVVIENKDAAKFAKISKKYKSKKIKAAKNLVVVFPIRNSLSYAVGPMKAYPALMEYAQAKGYKITGTYELYDMQAGKIFFVMEVKK